MVSSHDNFQIVVIINSQLFHQFDPQHVPSSLPILITFTIPSKPSSIAVRTLVKLKEHLRALSFTVNTCDNVFTK